MEPTLTLTLTIRSAKNLKRKNPMSKIESYVVVDAIVGDTVNCQRTPVDKEGRSNPIWNHQMLFALNQAAVQQDRVSFTFRVFYKRSILKDKLIGEFQVQLSTILANNGEVAKTFTNQLQKASKLKGELTFSSHFRENIASTSSGDGGFSGTAITSSCPSPSPGTAMTSSCPSLSTPGTAMTSACPSPSPPGTATNSACPSPSPRRRKGLKRFAKAAGEFAKDVAVGAIIQSLEEIVMKGAAHDDDDDDE